MTESDIEDNGPEERSPDDTSRNYWLGTRILQAILADVVFRERARNSSIGDLDVSLQETKDDRGHALMYTSPP